MKTIIKSRISIKIVSSLAYTAIIFGSSCSFDAKVVLAKEHVIKDNLILLKNSSNLGIGNQPIQSIKQTESLLNANSITDDFRYDLMVR